MADTNISPNMTLPVPVPGEDPGPDWANNYSACMQAIDSHNHSTGQGVPITPDGINVNVDLPMNGNNLTTARSVNFNVQATPLALATDIGCLYVSGKDLYYNDEDGNQVRITTGGNVNAGAGSITGLPSGTASASFAAATFTWRSATNTPANMAVGPLIVGANVANSKTVTISPNVAQPANYAMEFPLALPGATSIMNVDSAGQQGVVAPDNSTFGIAGGTYQVLDGGITNAKLAPANFNTATTGAFVNISSTSFSTIMSCNISSLTGLRPIMIVFTSELQTGTIGFMAPAVDSMIITLEIVRAGSTVLQQTSFKVPTNGAEIIPSWTVIDTTPISGTVGYALRGKVNISNVDFIRCGLYVMEL